MSRYLPFRIALVSTLVLNLAASPTILSAQQAPEDVPTITIRADTRLVIVDVVAPDKKGQPVTGLKPEDFTLEENGKKQKISMFEPPGIINHTAAAPRSRGIFSNHPENVLPSGAPTVLILDATNSSFSNQAYARSQMLQYVVDQSHTGQSVAVVTANAADPGGGGLCGGIRVPRRRASKPIVPPLGGGAVQLSG
jgi:hypothetical protein